jgi:hypothetical protein
MPGVDFACVRREITMEQVLALPGFDASKWSGTPWYGRCLWHESTSGCRLSSSANVEMTRFDCLAAAVRETRLSSGRRPGPCRRDQPRSRPAMAVAVTIPGNDDRTDVLTVAVPVRPNQGQ